MNNNYDPPIWENSGIERDKNGYVTFYYQCSKCGYEIKWGKNTPKIKCPYCKKHGRYNERGENNRPA